MHRRTMTYQRNITYSYHMHMNPPTLVSISGSLCKGISHYGYVYTPIVIYMYVHLWKSDIMELACTVGDYWKLLLLC